MTVQINEDELLASSFGVEGATSTSLSGETKPGHFSQKRVVIFEDFAKLHQEFVRPDGRSGGIRC